MSWVVIDASVALSWCFPDEQSFSSVAVLNRLNAGESALVPSIWSFEVLNSLLVGERRGRISRQQTQTFLEDIQSLRPTVDNVSLDQVIGPIQKICRDHLLTPYDALYVDLAMRARSPLASLDQPQKLAAQALGIECI